MAGRDPDIYQALLEDLSDGVMVVDFDGRVQVANPALCRMFRLDPADAVGRPFGEIFVAFEGFDDFTQTVLDAVVDRGGATRQVVSVLIGDERRSLSVTTSYLTRAREAVPERVAVIAVVSDVTEVREMRETELRMAKVIEGQLADLQDAYRDIETRNETLSMMMKRVQAARGLAMVFVVGLFLAIGAWYVRPLDLFGAGAARDAGFEAAEPGALRTMTVEPRVFRSTIALRGRLAPGRVVKVVSPIDSHVTAVHAYHGQRVTEGAPLVELDTDRLAVEYGRAQVEHVRLRKERAELENWEDSAEVARARSALVRAATALDDAERNLEQTAYLLDRRVVSASEHEEAQQRRRNRKLDFDAAERELAAVRAKGGEEAVLLARLEAENAHRRLRAYEDQLNLAAITAPIEGIVTTAEGAGDEPLAKGRPVARGELLLSIVDPERMSVATGIDEVDVGKIEVGQPAWITGPGFPALRIEGAVSHVSPQADAGSRTRNTPQFEIVVTLDRLDEAARDRLRVGMSAHVTIVVYRNPAALLVPITAVERSDGEAWLRVVDGNGDPERRRVELGLTTLDSVEVVAGLSAGDEVVLPG